MKITLVGFTYLLIGLLAACHFNAQGVNAQGVNAQLVNTDSPMKLISDQFELADGPAWDGSYALYVPDVKGEKLYKFIPATGKLSVHLPNSGRISAAFFNHGQLFLSDNGASQIVRLVGTSKKTIAGQDAEANPPARPNDLVVDNAGGIYYTLTRQKQVIYITPDGKQSVVVEGIETPNGIILSPDGKTLYVSSAATKTIWSYRVSDPGTVSPGKLFSKMDDGPERGADGMTVDRAGNVYCCGPQGVWIWDPAGKFITLIKMETKPINCIFGGKNDRTLFITGFGGLHAQAMNISGRAPHPPKTAAHQPKNSKRPSTTLPKNVTAHLDVVYASYGDRNLLTDIFVPKEKPGPHPTIVVVHGGGWLHGDKTKFRALALNLASQGFVVSAIEYRLGEEAQFPAGIHDCNASVRFLRANAKKYKIDPKRIGAVGGSAGGHLVGLMASGWKNKELQGEGGHPDRPSRLAAAVVMAGPLEMTTGNVALRSRSQPDRSNSNKWLGKTIDESPKLYALADAHLQIDADTPPIFFIRGEFDNPTANQPSSDKLKSLGVWTDTKIYDDGKHGCWNQLPWFTEIAHDIGQFFKERL